MIDATIVRLTIRQILGQKRSILMLLFAALPVLLALLYTLNNDSRGAQEWTAETALGGLIIGLVLPFTALVFGTAALGQEFEDGTAVYLLAKPIPRSTIILSKLLVSWLSTAVIIVLSTVPTALLGLSGEPQEGMILGFVVGGVAGSLAYCAAFLWLSIATSRALIVGLLYVFIWEGVVVSLFGGVKFFSISEYSLGIANLFISVPERIFDPRLSPAPAIILAGIVTVAATWYAIRSLRRWEIGEST
jgi:ABC-2 type transport system permease protein